MLSVTYNEGGLIMGFFFNYNNSKEEISTFQHIRRSLGIDESGFFFFIKSKKVISTMNMRLQTVGKSRICAVTDIPSSTSKTPL